MTIVMMGKKNGKDGLQFAFDDPRDAFDFYLDAIRSYREDNLKIVMLEEGEDR